MKHARFIVISKDRLRRVCGKYYSGCVRDKHPLSYIRDKATKDRLGYFRSKAKLSDLTCLKPGFVCETNLKNSVCSVFQVC